MNTTSEELKRWLARQRSETDLTSTDWAKSGKFSETDRAYIALQGQLSSLMGNAREAMARLIDTEDSARIQRKWDIVNACQRLKEKVRERATDEMLADK